MTRMFARHKALLLSCLLGLAWLATGPRTAAAPRTAADDDPLPKDALSRIGSVRFRAGDGSAVATYEGHTFGVNAVAFAPDTKSLASGSTDRTARVWNGKQRTLSMPSAVTGIAYLTDRKTIVTAGDDGIVRVWDIAGEK